jgi:putative SOS response-associated peptidase YedK
VPVDNFYERKKTGTGKQPYAIALADWKIMALAGLSETSRSSVGTPPRAEAGKFDLQLYRLAAMLCAA